MATIGMVAVEALSIAAETALRATTGALVADTYKTLKDKIVRWTHTDPTVLQKALSSKEQKKALAEDIDKQSPNDLAEVQGLVAALIDELGEKPHSGPIGIDIRRLEAARVMLAEINVTEGVGLRVKELVTPGDFKADIVTVGKNER